MPVLRYLQHKVFLALWGVALSVAGYLGWSLYQEHVSLRERSQTDALSLARLVAENAEATFQLADLSLRHAIETLPPVDLARPGNLPEGARHNLENYLRRHQERTPGVISMSLTDAKGVVLANTVGSPPGSNLGDRSYFLALRDSGDGTPAISEAVLGRVSGKWGIQVARRIEFPDGRFAGMLVANLGIEEYFVEFFKSLQLGSGAAVSLWNREQRLLVRYPVVEGAIGKDLVTPALSDLLRTDRAETVATLVSPVDGKLRIAGTRQLKRYPINAIVALDEAAYMAPWWRSLQVTVVLVGILLATAVFLTRQLVRNYRAEEGLRLAASVFSHAHEGIMITDARSRIIDVNRQMEELTGFTRQEMIGQTPTLLDSGHHDLKFFSAMRKSLMEQGSWRGDIWNRRKDGELYVQHTRISAVRDEDGRISHFVGMASDITDLKEEQSNLEKMAFHDPLTDLPNRILLADRMEQAITKSQRDKTLLAACYLDLDNFKPVNDQYGHAVGDQLLVNVANRWRGSVRGGDTVARLGGDEFVILLNGVNTPEECEIAVSRLLEAVSAPFTHGDAIINISASIGVALFPRDGNTPDELMRRADAMLYQAKNAGRSRFQFAL
ncbi:MAG: diguanylate cyclase domain-containing protein [Actinomycetota bacterium]